MEVGIRYCGGCNPRYDRVQFVEELKKRYPFIHFSPANETHEMSIAVCGCPAACTETADLQGTVIKILGGNIDELEGIL